MDPFDLTAAQRAQLSNDAMLYPAPDVPGLVTRPFNDTVLALCQQARLTLFTLEALEGAPAGMMERAQGLGVAELNRQSLILLFIVGFPDAKAMLRALRTPDFYEEEVLPWSLGLPHDPQRMARIFGEWNRYILHMAASFVQIVPKGEAGDTAPPNS